MFLFLGYRGQWSMTRTNQCFLRQAEDLFPHFLFGNIPGLIATPDRAGKNRISDNSNMWSILRPGANDISHAILGMPGRVAMSDAQAAEVNEIVWAVPLVHRRIF